MENAIERIWDGTTYALSSVMRGFERGVTSLFGSSNARYVKKLEPTVAQINELEPHYEKFTDAQLREETAKFKRRLAAGETLDDILVEAFALCREGGKRFLGMRHYDVQMLGGIVLHRGSIAEMVTGEGKTLVATLPSYLNGLTGKGVHVVTVNDYLARRDMEWMGPLHIGLGLTVGAIQADMKVAEKQKAYSCDITYGTNNEFGFDYLRDNMRPAARGDKRYPYQWQQSQGKLHYAIIDEVDNILIDEARTPLIISGPAHDDVAKYARADKIARQLSRGEVDKEGNESGDFIVNEKDHHVHLTDQGVRKAEHLAGVESFYTAGNMEWPHLIDNSLKAHYLYKLDVNYVVKEGRVVIVDEFTGRLMEGRQWSDGLHQAVEAKEGVKIKEESQTLATITLQNFFKLYEKLAGMTGTAMTEANEFWKIYELEVVAIPTNRAMQRLEHPDVIYRSETEKFIAVADEIERMNKWDVVVDGKGNAQQGRILKEDESSIHFQSQGEKQNQTIEKDKVKIERKGRPILIGTVSIEKSERLSALLEKRGIKHEVLNAKHHKREAEIVAQAGRLGAVTIATNMAGRGTDIVLGGNPETMAWAQLQDKYPTRLEVPKEEWDTLVDEIEQREGMREQGELVKSLGGLHVIGTERHEARRIDLQLRGRCGRQGDPGSSRFFLSLQDDLMRIFAGPWVEKILTTLGMQEGEAIESRMVTRRIEAAQKKVEERHFEARKNLLEYDEVMDEQRKRVYRYRQNILDGGNCKEMLLEMVESEIDYHVDEYLDKDFGVESFAEFAGKKLSTKLDAKQFRGCDFTTAETLAREEAERMAETQIMDDMDENLPVEEEESEWNWEALARASNVRWGVSVRDRELRKIGRDEVAEHLIQKAWEAIGRIDLSEAASFLDEDFGLRNALGWAHNKFGVEIPIEEVRGIEPPALKQLLMEKARQAYDQKEFEFPVMAGLMRYSTRPQPGAHARIDRDGLLAWAQQRFAVNLSEDDIKHKQREEIRDLLVAHSQKYQQKAGVALAKVQEKVGTIYNGADGDLPVSVATGGNGALDSLSSWLKDELHCEIPPQELAPLDRDELEKHLAGAVEEQFRPEMRHMERQLLLEIVDSAWKDHLLAMDYLRAAVGMRGYAQVDPKVEYKREGMAQFERMWRSIGQRSTDLIFRMEQLPEDFVRSSFPEGTAVHQQAESVGEMAQQQQEAIDGMRQNAEKVETIRNRGQKVGRNDPCPCGSGKKYKQCCMKKQ